MFCPKCGTKVLEGGTFCSKCGINVTVEIEKQTAKEMNIVNEKEKVESTVMAEEVLFKSGGGQIVNAVVGASGGYIKLTNMRLVHESLFGKMQVEVKVNDIISYQRAYNVSELAKDIVTDNAFIIYTKQGLAYKFTVGNREELFLILKQILLVDEQLPHESEEEAREYKCPEGHPGYEKSKKQNKTINILRGIIVVALIYFLISGIIGIFNMISSGGVFGRQIDLVKDGTFSGYPEETIGKAFDDFLSDEKWEGLISEDGETYVNVTGTALVFGKEAEIIVQFWVDSDAGTFEYYASEINGIQQSDLIFWGLLEAIYEQQRVQ